MKQKVDYIVKNKNYIGIYEYNGKKEKNNIALDIEPIVSRYMWNKSNLAIKVNNKKIKKYIYRIIYLNIT